MIKSLSYDQEEILSAIVELYCPAGFDADVTYGNGSFYKTVKRPRRCFDIDPLFPHVERASSCSLPLKRGSLRSAVFDPPFLTYISKKREHNSIMAKRFGGYYTYGELEKHYRETLNEMSRVLITKGVLVFKCQDIIHNHKMHPTHVSVCKWAQQEGFRLMDLFILGAKHRMPMPGNVRQRHARVFHSYFLVFEKVKPYKEDWLA